MPARPSDGFALIAESHETDGDAIIGEAIYGFDRASGGGEFAISVADRFRRKGLGSALLSALQCRAISLGHLDLSGETLKSNDEMQSLARKAGFEAGRALDWRAVRFDKRLSR
jgi:GNAT superfamily N-acetyltransferase